ncbi:flagellar biosynthetic protein FliO [Polycladidibacter stylochi]|uniref:flagellar biosynthetic protein FliO n=1 Tax=Polycladidibacter stylochi TaxID=1807766 RepID=UPI00083287B7|nr:flagellar biosynthetic protein FliO [Pseudovibrio stylochi]
MSDWLVASFGLSEGTATVFTAIISLAFVVALIAIIVPFLKRFARTSYKGYRNRQPRIAIMDATDVDARRRLLLIRRDNVEHLILVGGQTDIVVEPNIVRAMQPAATVKAPPQQPANFTANPAYAPAQTTAQTPPPPQAKAAPHTNDVSRPVQQPQPQQAHVKAETPLPVAPQQKPPQVLKVPLTPEAQALKPAINMSPAQRQARSTAEYQRHLAASRERLRKGELKTKHGNTDDAQLTEAQRQAQQVAAARALAASRASVTPPSAGPAARAASAFAKPNPQQGDEAAAKTTDSNPVENAVKLASELPKLQVSASTNEKQESKASEAKKHINIDLEEALKLDVTEEKTAPVQANAEPKPESAAKQESTASAKQTDKEDDTKSSPDLDQQLDLVDHIEKASTQETKTADEQAEVKTTKNKNEDKVAKEMEREMADLLNELNPH